MTQPQTLGLKRPETLRRTPDDTRRLRKRPARKAVCVSRVRDLLHSNKSSNSEARILVESHVTMGRLAPRSRRKNLRVSQSDSFLTLVLVQAGTAGHKKRLSNA